MESLAFRLAIVWRLAYATRGNPLADRHAANEQRIEIPEAVVRWSSGQEFAVENLALEPHTHARLRHYVKRLAQQPIEVDL